MAFEERVLGKKGGPCQVQKRVTFCFSEAILAEVPVFAWVKVELESGWWCFLECAAKIGALGSLKAWLCVMGMTSTFTTFCFSAHHTLQRSVLVKVVICKIAATWADRSLNRYIIHYSVFELDFCCFRIHTNYLVSFASGHRSSSLAPEIRLLCSPELVSESHYGKLLEGCCCLCFSWILHYTSVTEHDQLRRFQNFS